MWLLSVVSLSVVKPIKTNLKWNWLWRRRSFLFLTLRTDRALTRLLLLLVLLMVSIIVLLLKVFIWDWDLDRPPGRILKGRIINLLIYGETLQQCSKSPRQLVSIQPIESADCWPAIHSYNFIIRVKKCSK